MQEESNPIKDYLFDYIKKSEEKIQKLIAEKKFAEIIDDVITNCYDKVITIGTKEESVGVLATGLLHYLLTNALINSQRKVECQGIELDIIIPDIKTLENDPKKTLLICIPKSSNNIFPYSDSPGARAFQNLTIELIQKIEQDVALLQSPIVAAQYEQLLMSILLQSQYHNYWDELQAGYSPAAPHYVKKALTYLHEHADQAIDMETLVGHTGVSARSLYAGFQRFKGETPMSYLKSERLRRARADLEAADPAEVTVTDIATKWSFFHLGRFSGDYRKAFGESPSVTLKSKAIRI